MAETLLAREKYFKNGRKPLWARKTLYGRQKCSKDDSTPQSTAKTLDYWENPSLCGGQKPSIVGKTPPSKDGRNTQSTAGTLYSWENHCL